MNVKVKFRTVVIVCFLLFGSVMLVYASPTSSSSSSWGTVSNPDASQSTDTQGTGYMGDEQNTDNSQGSGSDNQVNVDAFQTSLRDQKVILLALESGPADTPKKSAVSLYDRGMQANKNGDYQKAKTLFEQALSINNDNPDILNMLAHTQLKVGLIDESLKNYNRALQLRPRFLEAREYLGETYIQAALRELTTLKSYGKDAEEQAEDLEKEIKKAGQGL